MSDSHHHKKPRSSVPFLPDPSKWIQTTPSSSSSSSSKKATQRPLVGFKNAFSTPPTTVNRRIRAEEATGTGVTRSVNALDRQRSLNGFLTPPLTRKVEGSVRKKESPGKTVGRSRLGVRVDSDSDDDGPSRSTRPLKSHRSAPVASSSSGTSDALDQPLPSTPKSRSGRRSTHRRTLTSSPTPPLPDPSSDRPITPVPDHILDIHRRLCGRDTQRMKSVRSPWRTGHALPTEVGVDISGPMGSPTKARYRSDSPFKPKDRSGRDAKRKKFEIDERAQDQALVDRRKRQDERDHLDKENKGNRLVIGSSQVEQVTPKKRKNAHQHHHTAVLSPRHVNIANYRVSAVSPWKDGPAPMLKRESSRILSDQDQLAFGHADPLTVYQAFRAPSPRIRTPPKLRKTHSGLSPDSAIPLGSPTPKRKPIPPKHIPATVVAELSSSSPSSTRDPGPSDPPSGSPVRSIGFKPVSMQAETLMTWSMGPQPQAHPQLQTDAEDPGDGIAPQRPDVRPVQAATSVKEDSTETQSLAPSNPSQSFPNFLPSPSRSSPPKVQPLTTTARPSIVVPETLARAAPLKRGSEISDGRGSLARFPTDLGVPETARPTRSSASPSKPAKRPRTSHTGWPTTGFAGPSISRNAEHTGPRSSGSTPSRSASKGKGKARTPTQATQSHLAQFGFFKERPNPSTRGFEEAWSDEEDLPFGEEEPDHAMAKEGTPPALKNESSMMRPVPRPPPHPHLRPAGLRELARRQECEEQVRPTFDPAFSSQPEVGVSTDHSSSFTTTDDDLAGGGMMNASAAAWWEGLEDRRSSEFDSIP